MKKMLWLMLFVIILLGSDVYGQPMCDLYTNPCIHDCGLFQDQWVPYAPHKRQKFECDPDFSAIDMAGPCAYVLSLDWSLLCADEESDAGDRVSLNCYVP